MKILIIGNGFDLAHYLPTQYSDFLDFVKAFKEGSVDDYEVFIRDIKNNNRPLYLKIAGLIKSNVLLDYFLSIYQERCKAGKNGWIDFEGEVSNIIQRLDEVKKDVESKYSISLRPIKIDRGSAKILEPFITYISDNQTGEHCYAPQFFDHLAGVILEALNKTISLLEIYLHEYVEKIECHYRIKDLDSLGIDHVFSFNYTDTYKKYYDSIGEAKYCFIHGKTKEISDGTCNLVLGIDEYLPQERINSDNEFVWFKKFYQRIYKETGSEYLDWIKHVENFNKRCGKAKAASTEVYIYGHSLDVTDKDVLSKILLMENTTTTIFYHNKDSMAKQISNLIKVIGEENLIRMTGGEDRLIRFIQSTPAVVDIK